MQEFISYVQQTHPELLCSPERKLPLEEIKKLAHGTTIVGVCYAEGVILAGDRRMTAGTRIDRNLADKVIPIDTHAAIAYSGTVATCTHMAEIIRISQNNYRKMRGRNLSLEGKAKYLSQIIRQNMDAAFQGLVFFPLLAGYDTDAEKGFLFSFDIAGAVYKNNAFAATGSGGEVATQTSLLHRKETGSFEQALQTVLKALHSAAEHDAATSGPEKQLPRLYVLNKKGGEYIDDTLLKEHISHVMRNIGA